MRTILGAWSTRPRRRASAPGDAAEKKSHEPGNQTPPSNVYQVAMNTRRPHNLVAMHGLPCVGSGSELATLVAAASWQGLQALASFEGCIRYTSKDPAREVLPS